MKKLDPKFKAKWIADLRASPDKQGAGCLRPAEYKYCCLGRAAVVGNLEFKEVHYGCWEIGDGYNSGGLPPEFRNRIGLDLSAQIKLIEMNDLEGASFAQIADWIEANL